ncbi:glycosyltransferase family 2 protein [Natronomonas marina]|uniref:glycosyltransferase family 2 protein n=1 Tax=Natronomonas marina TaxID=2961939 RepID=UPI0020C95A6B|nr:glycosyltransferase family 2 protein [Natronomonas marina]
MTTALMEKPMPDTATDRPHRSTADRADAADRDGDAPLVSVVLPTYDRPSYLRKAVESVLAQTYEPIELVVVDDHSERPAAETLSGMDLGDLAAVRCRRHEENRGVNAARNTGIEAASGEYVAFLDDDDRWVPEKTERQVAAFETAGDDVGVVYTGKRTVEPEGTGERIPPAVEGDMTKALLCRNVVGTMSVVMVRADLARAVPLDESFPAWADLAWYVSLSRRAGFKRLPEPLAVYEFTSHGRLSDDLEKKRRGYERFLERFGPLAAEYGRRFHRKMRGWAAYRVGRTALVTGDYAEARRFLAAAVAAYPVEPKFGLYLLAAAGGRPTHGLARRARELGRVFAGVTSR